MEGLYFICVQLETHALLERKEKMFSRRHTPTLIMDNIVDKPHITLQNVNIQQSSAARSVKSANTFLGL